MGPELFKKLAERYPFMSFCTYAGNEYIGIIQNRDTLVTTIYDFGAIVNAEQKERFLDLANIWWWESNRIVPINVFLKGEWQEFRPCLKTFTNKDLQILHGPATSLAELAKKKTKRKSITLVRRVE